MVPLAARAPNAPCNYSQGLAMPAVYASDAARGQTLSKSGVLQASPRGTSPYARISTAQDGQAARVVRVALVNQRLTKARSRVGTPLGQLENVDPKKNTHAQRLLVVKSSRAGHDGLVGVLTDFVAMTGHISPLRETTLPRQAGWWEFTLRSRCSTRLWRRRSGFQGCCCRQHPLDRTGNRHFRL
jgi:hypothetical protein